MARAVLLSLCVAAAAACGGPRVVKAPVAKPRPTGAVLLALPGNAPPIAVGHADVIRGRTRWHVDADGGATRARDVLAEAVAQAVALPAHVGGGVAMLTEHGIASATPSGAVRPIARADLQALSVGRKELWARERGTLDWVRVDLETARAMRVAPPIAAPILSAWSSVSGAGGRPITAGPEFAGPTFALAIIDLLGPVLSRDGGENWTPLDANAVAAAFPTSAPSRVVRDGAALFLASDDRAVPVSTSGALGASVPPPKAGSFAEVASIRAEATAPFGVMLPGDEILVSDGARFATMQLDPVRVLHTWRAPDLGRCELTASTRQGELALAVCVRHQAGTGGQLVAGPVTDTGSGPSLVSEKTFAFGSAHRISPSGAAIVASSCGGTNEGGIDLLAATKVCVRDDGGQWNDVTLTAIAGRRFVLGRADGGVIVLREDPSGHSELVAVSRGTAQPLRLKLDYKLGDVIGVDETARGRLVVWRRGMTDLRAVRYEVSDTVARLAEELPRTILDGGAMVGTYGERAFVAVSTPAAGKEPPSVEASITTDGGRTWGTSAWPEGVPPLDTTPPARRVECGALGCRVFGWSRIGWQKTVTSYDRVVSLADADGLATMPAAPARANTITAKCTTVGASQVVPLASVPTSPPGYPPQPGDVLLGLPPPKVPKDHTQVLTRFGRVPNVRGGVISVGPLHGAWGDNARTTIRFASDLDPLGVVHESATFGSPFPDRMSAMYHYGVGGTHAWALAPGRILLVLCSSGRCDALRVTAGLAPERIDLGNVVMNTFVNAGEMGGSLAIFGTGTKRDVATPTKVVEPLPFVTLVTAQGATTSFLARSDYSREVVTIDPIRGAFGIVSDTAVPSWSAGTTYVLPLGLNARPAGSFETLSGSAPEITRPTKPCAPSAHGWDDLDHGQTRTLSLSIDGLPSLSLQAVAGAVRTRIAPTSTCLDRITVIARNAAFQFDPATQRAIHYSIDTDGKTGRKSELSCTIGWE